ncbi:MAG: hypothetical protein Q4E43_02355 [Akkermansia sp.]|nr:hypothetical protein [Akkermansia sp.]
MKSTGKGEQTGFLYNIYFRKYNTLPACVLISVVLLALTFLCAKFFIETSYDNYFSFVLGVASFLMAWWTICTAARIKAHVKSKVSLNAIRRLKETWATRKLTKKYLNEEEMAEARAAVAKALNENIHLDEAIKEDIQCLSDCLQKERVCATEFLCNLDAAIETINML